jgi:hypothetical protein
MRESGQKMGHWAVMHDAHQSVLIVDDGVVSARKGDVK